MALFGNKKDAGTWFEFQSAKNKRKFQNVDSPTESLGKKLIKEQLKRRAAEKEAARWKEKCKLLEEQMKNFTDNSGKISSKTVSV